jgi:tetratricopeptide (TPR) repeat protein
MGTGSSPGQGSASTEPQEGPAQKARPSLAPIRFLGDVFRDSFALSRKLSSGAWRTLPTYLPFYLLVIVAGYAAWEGRKPVTTIAPFQLPKADLPFSGDIVADRLQDSLTSIHNDIERERDDPRLRPTDMDLPDLRGLIIPKFGRVQVPTRFAVEVKGLSYEGIISAAHAVMGTETTILGDVILMKGNEFILVARTADAGPWKSVSSPISAEGLDQASRDLAEKILKTQDPTLAGAALLKDGEVDQALAVFNRARTLEPTDERVELNLCTGFDANRRYEDAIECYQRVLDMNPSSPQEVAERLAQAYYLNGNRDKAIKRFEDLAHKQGYRDALLALGKALDDTGHHKEALKVYDEFLAQAKLDRDKAIAHVNRGVTLVRLGKHADALAEYQKALQYAPDDILIRVNIAVEKAEAGDLDAGIAQLQNVVDENVNADSVPFAFLRLGTLLQDKGDWRSAGDQFRKATELWPNYTDAHRKLAYALAHECRRSEALSEYHTVAKLSPTELDRRYSQVLANQWLGDALREQGNYSTAASPYREAIRLKPDYRVAYCELGLVFEKQGHLGQAIQEYRTALLAESKELDGPEWLVLAHHRLGEALVREGRAHRAEGIGELREALEIHKATAIDPDDLDSYLYLGEVLYEEGNFVDAAAEYKEVIKIYPQSAAGYNGLCLTLDKQGLVEEATLECKSATKLEPSVASYHANLAHELDRQDLNEEAAAERKIAGALNSAAIARQPPRCEGMP